MDFYNAFNLYAKCQSLKNSGVGYTYYKKLLDEYSGGRILDCAVGTGEITLKIMSEGYDIECSDSSLEMIKLFNRNAIDLSVLVKGKCINWIDLGSEYKSCYDLVICKGNSFSYLNSWDLETSEIERNELLPNLISMYFSIRSKGALYIDFPSIEKLENKHFSSSLKKTFDGVDIEIFERVEIDSIRKIRKWSVDMKVDMEEINFSRYSHLITRTDVIELLHKAGFSAVCDAGMIDERSHYYALLAKK